jgi:hypothetical protein
VTLALNPAILAVCPSAANDSRSRRVAGPGTLFGNSGRNGEVCRSADHDLFDMPITLTVISHINLYFYHKHVNQHYHKAIMHEELQEHRLVKIFFALLLVVCGPSFIAARPVSHNDKRRGSVPLAKTSD